MNALLWLIIAVTLSTVTSRTIYGLRQQVKEASEIGQYTLEEKIGSGGMGEVWRARHRMLIRPAAVKLVTARDRASMSGRDPELRLRRFEREARATAGLKSPHTVQLYDFGVTDDGTLYYVMELLDGMDLDTLVDRFGPVPAERAIHLLLQVCASLDDAHQNGLVHRDIKPANIVVSRIGADLGLRQGPRLRPGQARERPAERRERETHRRRQRERHPGFHRAGGRARRPADRSPRRHLFARLRRVLAGHRQAGVRRTGSIKVMFDHVHTPPAPPSSRSELPIPPELDALILECLEKDPEKRPASAAALRSRLQAIPLATPWTHERAESWWSLHAPRTSSERPVADVVLSQEARPLRVIRQARH